MAVAWPLLERPSDSQSRLSVHAEPRGPTPPTVRRVASKRRARLSSASSSAPGWSNATKKGNLVGVWLKSHRFLRWSEVPCLSSRVRRAAASLRTQSQEPVVASCGLSKKATLTMLRRGGGPCARASGRAAPPSAPRAAARATWPTASRRAPGGGGVVHGRERVRVGHRRARWGWVQRRIAWRRRLACACCACTCM